MAWSSARCGASPGCSNTSANLSHNSAYYEPIPFSPSFWPSLGRTTAKQQSDSGSAQSSRSQALAETRLAWIEPGTVLASTATLQESGTNDKVFQDQSMCGLYFRKKSIPKMMLVVSDSKTFATISKKHPAESSLYTPNDKWTASVVFMLLPSANVTTKVYWVLTCYPTASATALVTKLWVAPESTIQLIMRPLHTASNYSKQGHSSCYKFDSFDWTNVCKVV